MRVTVRSILMGGSVVVLITTAFLWSQCRPPQQHTNVVPDASLSEASSDQREFQQTQQRRQPLMTNHQNEIPCVINQEFTIPCRRDDTDVYIPWSFIHEYFEIYGNVVENADGNEVFEWSHSNSHVFEPSKPYKPTAKFINFHQFNVEARERVKCISATEGVPISTQWSSSGYNYPIQIAQFGLSHYSKYLEEPKAKKIMLEDGVHKKINRWKYDRKFVSVGRLFNEEIGSYVFKFSAPESLKKRGALLPLSDSISPNIAVLNVYLRFVPRVNSSLTVTLQTLDKKADLYYLHYICSNKLIETVDQHVYYGLGPHYTSWKYLTRNIMVDILKGAAASSQPKKMRKRLMKSKIRIVSVEFRGEGAFTNLSLASNEHIRHFYDAADWLINNQDERGGWSIPVTRKVVPGLLVLGPGWYSAMAQGQAMSLLVRAAYFSGNEHYIEAAAKATRLFHVNSTEGGIRTYFPGGYVWYEEYPTTPPLFVLNGFMYSLLGLYDLKVYQSGLHNPADDLFRKGMESLKKLLPLYDTGQGSLYDLRHFTSHVAPNLARWDYHTTHINELLTLASVDKSSDTLLYDTAQRWKEYMVGRRAKHN